MLLVTSHTKLTLPLPRSNLKEAARAQQREWVLKGLAHGHFSALMQLTLDEGWVRVVRDAARDASHLHTVVASDIMHRRKYVTHAHTVFKNLEWCANDRQLHAVERFPDKVGLYLASLTRSQPATDVYLCGPVFCLAGK